MLTMMIALAAASATAPADLNSWVEQVNRQFEQHMQVPFTADRGIATVTFRRDPTGRPVDVQVRSGNPFIVQAALRTVREVGPLPPLPAAVPSDQRITFNFLVGTTGHEPEYYRTRTRLLESASRANTAYAARAGSPTQVAALAR